MKKKIGILELCASPATNLSEQIIAFERKQYVGLTPQAISVWCRQMGHQVHYATYYGYGDPKDKLPNDLDLVFISTFTYLAPLAYALSKVYRMEGTRTVIGGPHAKAFPQDALRYFDLVVLDCDKALIADIIADHFPPHSIISSARPFVDVPTIEERLPELKASVFWRGKPFPYSFIPMLASIGCPYSCNFCVDWNNPYQALSSERLAEDLRYASENLPGVKLLFCDPNFGIRFDETLSIFETIPPERRNPYAMETSLTNMRSRERLERLRDTKCLAVAPGIESWALYSNKAGVGNASGRAKLDQVVEHLQMIAEYVPYIQANFIFGIDADEGNDPFELTEEFVLRLPSIFAGICIPVAYGGTPLQVDLSKEGRILKAMPFTFYFTPYLMMTLKNYDALTYYQKIADYSSLLISNKLLGMRLAAKTPGYVKFVNFYRTFTFRAWYWEFRRIARHLQTDSHLRAFHAGESQVLPDFYAAEYKRQLGRYAELMPITESQPLLSDAGVASFVTHSPAAGERVISPNSLLSVNQIGISESV